MDTSVRPGLVDHVLQHATHNRKEEIWLRMSSFVPYRTRVSRRKLRPERTRSLEMSHDPQVAMISDPHRTSTC